MEKANLQTIKRALLREVEQTLWKNYRQNLSEVLNDLSIRRFSVPSKPTSDDVLRVIRTSGLFTTFGDRHAHDLQDALQRMENGSFGLCLRCGRDIPVAVLERDPTIRYCAACQQHQNNRSENRRYTRE